MSEGIRNQTANRFILTPSARGPKFKKEPIQKIIITKSYPSHSQPIRSMLSYSTSTNTIYKESVTFPTKTINTTNTTTSKITDIPKLNSLPKIQDAFILPVDHFYNSDQITEYYDNVDEISIASQIESLNHNRNHSSSLQSSSVSHFLPTSRTNESYIRNAQHKIPVNSHIHYNQSTLKSIFMNSSNATIPERLFLNTFKTEYTTEKVQQQSKIHSFVVSDHQPSSFKPQQVTSSTILKTKSFDTNPNNNNFNAFVNTQRLRTTLITSTTIPSTIISTSSTLISQFISNKLPYSYLYLPNQSPESFNLQLSRDQLAQNKIIPFTLSSNLGITSKKEAQSYKSPYSQVSIEETQLVKTRQPENNFYQQILSLNLKPIEPTTYAPANPFKPSALDNIKNTTPFAFPNVIIDDSSEADSYSHSRRRPYLNNLHSELIIPTRFPSRTTILSSTTTSSTTPIPTTTTNVVPINLQNSLINFKAFNESIQSFTSRGLIFKEALNRTFEPQSQIKPIVSPFISLENQRFTNAIRNTSPSPQIFKDSSKYILTSTNVSIVPTRSYFLITAPARKTTELSSLTTSSVYTTTYRPPSTTPELTTQIYSTDHSRGHYRPYVTYTTKNSYDVEEPTTYVPRMRYNTRSQTLVDTVTEAPVSFEKSYERKKMIRSKSTTSPYKKSFEQFDPSNEPTSQESFDTFVASQALETAQFKPIFAGKKSFLDENFNATSLTIANNFTYVKESVNHSNELQNLIIQITDKPIYYTRYRNNVLEETSTKQFRPTIEMPEINVSTKKQTVQSHVINEKNNIEDGNESINHSSVDSLDLIENDYNREHEVDYAYVDSTTSITSATNTTTTTTIIPKTEAKTEKILLSTYSTTTSTQYPTTIKTSTTTYRTTEKSFSTTYPKSMIPPRVSRVNNAIKTSIEATLPRRVPNPNSAKCNDNSPNALQCNEIPSRYYNDKKNNTH